ncbi:MAG: hypothetical protein IJ387_10735, partial [Thermoguttaceae bacterium]|nr:hypothetical protein [Thermoguttaceae bacterium]
MRFSFFLPLRRDVWRRSFPSFLLLGFFASTFAASFAQEVREWRDAAGRPIMTSTNKKLVGTLDPEYDDPAKVRINMDDKTFRFTLANLSEADQKYVASERAKKTASDKPEPATESKPTATKPTSTPKPTATKPTTTSKPTATKPTTTSKPTATKPTSTPKPTATKPTTTSKPTATKPTTTSK